MQGILEKEYAFVITRDNYIDSVFLDQDFAYDYCEKKNKTVSIHKPFTVNRVGIIK